MACFIVHFVICRAFCHLLNPRNEKILRNEKCAEEKLKTTRKRDRKRVCCMTSGFFSQYLYRLYRVCIEIWIRKFQCDIYIFHKWSILHGANKENKIKNWRSKRNCQACDLMYRSVFFCYSSPIYLIHVTAYFELSTMCVCVFFCANFDLSHFIHWFQMPFVVLPFTKKKSPLVK